MGNNIHWLLMTKRNILKQNRNAPKSNYSKEIIEFSKTFKKHEWHILTKSIRFINLVDEQNVVEARKLAKKLLDIKK